MKPYLFILFSSLFFAACSSSSDHEQKSADANRTAIENEASSADTYRAPLDMVDELYQDLRAQNEALDSLEKEMISLRKQQAEAVSPYVQYNGKSKRYYNDALSLTNNIQDSLLKNSVEVLIKRSQHRFETNSASLDQKTAQLNKTFAQLEDNYAALKIILTLDLIEKYQQQKLPESPSHAELIKRIEKSMKQIDSLKEAK